VSVTSIWRLQAEASNSQVWCMPAEQHPLCRVTDAVPRCSTLVSSLIVLPIAYCSWMQLAQYSLLYTQYRTTAPPLALQLQTQTQSAQHSLLYISRLKMTPLTFQQCHQLLSSLIIAERRHECSWHTQLGEGSGHIGRGTTWVGCPRIYLLPLQAFLICQEVCSTTGEIRAVRS
jgi:hypothetical protein